MAEGSIKVLPRQIYTLWAQGEAAAPPIVRMNFDRWRRLNPDFEFRVLTQTDLDELQSRLPAIENITIQSKSDVLRLHLLSGVGGVWVDASVFPVVPLRTWIDDAIHNDNFFAFARPEEVSPLSSWFLAATPESQLIKKWNDLTSLYWSVAREPVSDKRKLEFLDNPLEQMQPFTPDAKMPYPYFWLHHLFCCLLQTDEEAAALWRDRESRSFKPAHEVQRIYLEVDRKNAKLHRRLLPVLRRKMPSKSMVEQAAFEAEVQKLDWRYPSYQLDWLSELPSEWST